jgi:hypothetical protein
MMLANAAQRDDPGMIVNTGLTSGPMNDRALGSATNWVDKSESKKEEHKQQDLEDGGWMALLWNVMVNSIPRIITAEYDDCIAKWDLPRMPTTLEDSNYEIKLGKHRYQFTGGDLAPPAAMAAWNYQRYACLD